MNHEIRFIDSRYNQLFTVPDGGNLVVTQFDGEKAVRPCKFLDEYHFEGGHYVYHICEFAERMEQNGAVYAPEILRPGDCTDTYEIYQIEDVRGTDYCFRPYAEAAKSLNGDDYVRRYAGVLAPQTTMEYLFVKHNQDRRPFGRQMRSLSVSDVMVLHRNGQNRAFYVDNTGFQEVPVFLGPEAKRQTPQRTDEKRGREHER